MRRLPPLAAVRVFEAAARHENFTAAAQELGMTQAAVSYQVRLLEERIGTPLFVRVKKRVLLTDAGRRVAPEITRSLDTIANSFSELRADDEALLTVSSSNTFAGAWLAWRLGAFQMANPAIAVRVETSDVLADFTSGEVDCGIRYGAGGWDGLAQDFLIAVDFTPMCSPELLARHGPTLAPADLVRLPLLNPTDIWWQQWFGDAGAEMPGGGLSQGLRLDIQAHAGNAAMGGQGVALLTPFFWRNDLAAGRLVQPFSQISTMSQSYWLVYPEHRARSAKIRKFRDWLVAEIARDMANGAEDGLTSSDV